MDPDKNIDLFNHTYVGNLLDDFLSGFLSKAIPKINNTKLGG